MPRYFFHIMDGRAVVDTEGTEFDSLGDVRIEAVRLAAGILSENTTGLVHGQAWQLTVADTAGDTVFSLRFEANHHGY